MAAWVVFGEPAPPYNWLPIQVETGLGSATWIPAFGVFGGDGREKINVNFANWNEWD